MIDFESRRYPLTGFGDDANASIKFMLIRSPGRDPEHAWEGGAAKLATHEPLHSNDVIEQYHGRGPMTLTTRLWFRDREALEALWSVVGRAATLRYAWGITLTAGGEKQTLADGRSYLVLPNTTLVGLTGIQTPRGQLPEATATFRRPVGVGVLYDYAHYAEGDE
jgi:hypothetical protein